MKRFIFTTCAIALAFCVKAQQGQLDVINPGDHQGVVRFYDPAAVGAKKAEPLALTDIYGTPFWDDHWNPGYLILRNGTAIKLHDIRLNQFSHQVHYLDGADELATDAVNVKKVVLLKAKDTTQLLARFEAFPDLDNEKQFSFYRVANDGKYRLLELQKASVKTSPYDPSMGKAESKWLTKSRYAIAEFDLVHPLSEIDKEKVSEILKADPAAQEWLKKNKVKNEADLVAFLDQLNKKSK